jgi:hypothetical protein
LARQRQLDVDGELVVGSEREFEESSMLALFNPPEDPVLFSATFIYLPLEAVDFAW